MRASSSAAAGGNRAAVEAQQRFHSWLADEHLHERVPGQRFLAVEAQWGEQRRHVDLLGVSAAAQKHVLRTRRVRHGGKAESLLGMGKGA